MSILGIILWALAIVWILGIIAVAYGIMTAEDNVPDEPRPSKHEN
jgi:hypothetical protein